MNENTMLGKLQKDLEEKEQNELETNADNFRKEDMELTDQEREVIDQTTDTAHLVVSDTDANGNTVQIPIGEYVDSLDKKVEELKDSSGNVQSVIKTLNRGDIQADVEKLKIEAREKAISAFHAMAVTDTSTISDDDYIKINNEAIKMLMNRFGMVKLDTDVIIQKLQKMTLKQICALLPDQFVALYTTPSELSANNYKAKERLLATIGYLGVTGPEMDYLYEYIENENKLALVSSRLLQCQIDFSEMLKDEKTVSEIIKETLKLSPMDTSFWAHYIKQPNRVHNEFAQRAVIQTKYKEAYQKLLDDYQGDDEINIRAREIIQNEIEEADHKYEVYTSICNLDLPKELWATLVARLKENKKLTWKYLTNEAIAAVERVRRCKQNLPFPGYKGTEKTANVIYDHYIGAFTAMIARYNETITNIVQKDPEHAPADYSTVTLPGYQDEMVAETFSALLVILMGRILKKLYGNHQDKYDAITLDSYFQIFCRMGMDIYIMQDFWTMMKDFVQYTIDNVRQK